MRSMSRSCSARTVVISGFVIDAQSYSVSSVAGMRSGTATALPRAFSCSMPREEPIDPNAAMPAATTKVTQSTLRNRVSVSERLKRSIIAPSI